MIPVEYSEFAATHHRMRGAWIVKPVASSRGRGIFIVSHPNQERNHEILATIRTYFRLRHVRESFKIYNLCLKS